MNRGLRVFLLLLAVTLVTACVSLGLRYIDQRNYQEALENSNFIQWSREISADAIEYAVIRRGYGADEVKSVLSLNEIKEVCQILNNLSLEEFSLSNDGKGYGFLDGQDADINFYIRDNTDEFEFRYRPSNPQELYIRSNSEMGDSYKNHQNRWTTNDALIDFILTYAPGK